MESADDLRRTGAGTFAPCACADDVCAMRRKKFCASTPENFLAPCAGKKFAPEIFLTPCAGKCFNFAPAFAFFRDIFKIFLRQAPAPKNLCAGNSQKFSLRLRQK